MEYLRNFKKKFRLPYGFAIADSRDNDRNYGISGIPTTFLLDRRGAVVATAAEKLLTYALGRRVEYFDMPAVRVIVRDAARNDYRFSSLIAGVVKSLPFQMKRYEGGTEP